MREHKNNQGAPGLAHSHSTHSGHLFTDWLLDSSRVRTSLFICWMNFLLQQMYILSHTAFSLFVSTNASSLFTAQDGNQNLVQEEDFQFHKNKYTANKPHWLSKGRFASCQRRQKLFRCVCPQLLADSQHRGRELYLKYEDIKKAHVKYTDFGPAEKLSLIFHLIMSFCSFSAVFVMLEKTHCVLITFEKHKKSIL